MRLSLCPLGCQESDGFQVDYQLRCRFCEIWESDCSSVEARLLRSICRRAIAYGSDLNSCTITAKSSGNANRSSHVQSVHRDSHADDDLAGTIHNNRIPGPGPFDVKLIVFRRAAGTDATNVYAIIVCYRSAADI